MIDYQQYGDYQFVKIAESQATSQLEKELVKRLKDVVESRDNVIKDNDELAEQNDHLHDVINWIDEDYEDLYETYDQLFIEACLLMVDYISENMGKAPKEFVELVGQLREDVNPQTFDEQIAILEEMIKDCPSLRNRLPLFDDFAQLVSEYVKHEDHQF